jgi:hypothetical protein
MMIKAGMCMKTNKILTIHPRKSQTYGQKMRQFCTKSHNLSDILANNTEIRRQFGTREDPIGSSTYRPIDPSAKHGIGFGWPDRRGLSRCAAKTSELAVIGQNP